MERDSPRRPLSGLLMLLLLSFAGWALWSGALRVPDAWNPFAPLRIDDAPNWLTRHKLDRASADRAACAEALAQAGMRATPLEDRRTGEGCGFDHARRISGTTLDTGEPFALSCRAALSLALWERHGLQQAARRHLGSEVAGIEHYGSYACRNLYGREGGRRSQHATADAFDIAGFVLADGRRVHVLEHWRAAALALRETLGVELIGRSRKQKIALHSDQVEEVLTVHGREYRYRQIEGSFTQPNGGINQQMLGWATDRVRGLGGDLLELYCGNGNFTAVLAAQFERVLATEISKSSVQAARHNLQANGVGNVELVRMSSEEISDALAGTRPYRRLAHLDLQDYRFSTLLVDPPRAGLDDVTRRLAARFDNVLYISCNPHTQRADIAALADSHAVKALAVFDQFPYTHHLECGVLLQRR